MRTLFVVLLGLIPALLNAQNTQTIKGTVLDKQSLQALPGVQVEIVGSEPKKGSMDTSNKQEAMLCLLQEKKKCLRFKWKKALLILEK